MKPNLCQILFRRRRNENRVVELEFAKPYRVAPATGLWVMCLSGTAWLTRYGCHADVILLPGQVAHLLRAEDPLIVGMPRCRLRITTEREQLAGLMGVTLAPADGLQL